MFAKLLFFSVQKAKCPLFLREPSFFFPFGAAQTPLFLYQVAVHAGLGRGASEILCFVQGWTPGLPFFIPEEALPPGEEHLFPHYLTDAFRRLGVVLTFSVVVHFVSPSRFQNGWSSLSSLTVIESFSRIIRTAFRASVPYLLLYRDLF